MTPDSSPTIFFFVLLILLPATVIIIYIFQPALTQTPLFDHADNVFVEKLEMNKNATIHGGNNYLLSLVIPAFNEEERLPPMLKSTLEFLHSSKDELVKHCNEILAMGKDHKKEQAIHQQSLPFQIIIVNDGSSDATVQSVQRLVKKEYIKTVQTTTAIKFLTLKQNAGKGAAVKAGMLHSTANLALMLDADGATTIDSLYSLLNEMKTSRAHIVFGSRAHLQDKSKAERSFVRTLLMKAFHFFVEFLIESNVKDTQCGFKLFHGDVIQSLFGNLHLQRWAFDTELIVIAKQLGLPVAEVGVEW
jgi:dolichyl-phosphate beta-glucosyltransferase